MRRESCADELRARPASAGTSRASLTRSSCSRMTDDRTRQSRFITSVGFSQWIVEKDACAVAGWHHRRTVRSLSIPFSRRQRHFLRMANEATNAISYFRPPLLIEMRFSFAPQAWALASARRSNWLCAFARCSNVVDCLSSPAASHAETLPSSRRALRAALRRVKPRP